MKFPPYEVRTLPNGLQVVVVLQHEQPAVSMRLLVRAGSASDPLDKLGLAHLTASLLDQGTTTKSAQQIADAIDFIGGAMGTGAGTDLSYLNMVVMKDSFDTGMRLLSDMARHPAFAPAEIDRQRQQMLSGIQVSQQDPSCIANAVFDRLVYGFHPVRDAGHRARRRRSPRSRATTSSRSTRGTSRRTTPSSPIVGDVTADEAFAEAKKVFGDWEQHDRRAPTTTPTRPIRRAALIVVDKPDAVQTEVRVGHLGIARKQPGLHGAQPRHPHPGRRGQQPPASGAAGPSAA